MTAPGFACGPLRPDGGGWRVEVVVPAASPWFADHFPGRPVLPAIGHLALADDLHARAAGAGRLVRVGALRLTAPVTPGAALLARLGAPEEDGRCRFELLSAAGGAPLSSGSLTWSASAPADAAEPPPDRGSLGSGAGGAPPAGDGADAFPVGPGLAAGEAVRAGVLAWTKAKTDPPHPPLPHGPRARFVTELLARGDDRATCRGAIPADHAAAGGGAAPAFVAVELAAQTAAALPAGEGETERSGPRTGYLVRLREVELPRERIPLATALLAEVHREGAAGPLTRFRFRVCCLDGRDVASGTLTTWVGA